MIKESYIAVTLDTMLEVDGCNLAKYITDNIPNIGNWNSVSEQLGDTPERSYFTTYVSLTVETALLYTCLVSLETMRAGYVEGDQVALASIFKDMHVEIHYNSDDSTDSLIETSTYILDKVQDQQRTITTLETKVVDLTDQFIQIAKILTDHTSLLQAHQQRYESMQVFIHSYIDLKAMSEVVVNMANIVDSDLLEDFPSVRIH